MKRFSGFLLLAATLASLPGCGWLWGEHGYFRDRDNDYLQARQTQPLQLPAGVDAKPMDPLLPIPDYVSSLDVAHSDHQVPRPQPLAADSVSPFSLEKNRSQRWLLARYALSDVYPPVRQFFVDGGFRLAEEHPNTGEFITEWQSPGRLSGALAGRFGAGADGQQEVRVRVRIEPAVSPNSSEVHVVTARRSAGSQAEPGFSASRADSASEAGVLDDLLASLSSGKNDSVSLLASSYDAPQRAQLGQDGSGNPILRLSTDFNRAWSSVGRALQKGDLRVDDLNRSTGLYYINLAEGARKDDDSPGLLGRLFGADEKKTDESRAQHYQVRLSTVGEEVQVTVEQGIDKVAPQEISQKILGLIKNNLS